jgi:hypothetical protein
MIAAATGNPMANAPPIAKMNAESRFTSGRRLSTDPRTLCPEAPGNWCLKMVNKVLIAGH